MRFYINAIKVEININIISNNVRKHVPGHSPSSESLIFRLIFQEFKLKSQKRSVWVFAARVLFQKCPSVPALFTGHFYRVHMISGALPASLRAQIPLRNLRNLRNRERSSDRNT